MIEQIKERIAALVHEREQHNLRVATLRQMLHQAERDDHAYAAVIGELESFLGQMLAAAPPGTGEDATR